MQQPGHVINPHCGWMLQCCVSSNTCHVVARHLAEVDPGNQSCFALVAAGPCWVAQVLPVASTAPGPFHQAHSHHYPPDFLDRDKHIQELSFGVHYISIL